MKKVDGIVDNASESVDKVTSTAKEVNTTAKTLQKRGINVNTSELKETMDEFLPQIEYLAQTLNSLEQKDRQFVVSKQSTKENVQNEVTEENNKKEIELVEQSILDSTNEIPKTE